VAEDQVTGDDRGPEFRGPDADGVTPQDRHEFARELVVVARRWRRHMNERLRTQAMSTPRWSALYWLAQSPEGLSQKDLAERVGVEPATLVRTIDSLEEQGLAERRPCRHDRRVKFVHATDAAQPLLDRMASVGDAVRAELMADIPDDEFRAGLRLLRRLRGSLEAEPKADAGKVRLPDFIE
jgi:MarR family transcriptional regulator for hemolysin